MSFCEIAEFAAPEWGSGSTIDDDSSALGKPPPAEAEEHSRAMLHEPAMAA